MRHAALVSKIRPLSPCPDAARCALPTQEFTAHDMPLDAIAWIIIAVAVFGVIVRPFGSPEYLGAGGGAILLVLIGVVPPGAAAGAVGKGTDVYLFLIGMMVLSEVA